MPTPPVNVTFSFVGLDGRSADIVISLDNSASFSPLPDDGADALLIADFFLTRCGALFFLEGMMTGLMVGN